MVHVLQLAIVGIWCAALVVHTRRLLRLACVEQLRNWEGMRVRSGLKRIWWWLGQDEFWKDVHNDGLRCVELTLMLFVLSTGMYL